MYTTSLRWQRPQPRCLLWWSCTMADASILQTGCRIICLSYRIRTRRILRYANCWCMNPVYLLPCYSIRKRLMKRATPALCSRHVPMPGIPHASDGRLGRTLSSASVRDWRRRCRHRNIRCKCPTAFGWTVLSSRSTCRRLWILRLEINVTVIVVWALSCCSSWSRRAPACLWTNIWPRNSILRWDWSVRGIFLCASWRRKILYLHQQILSCVRLPCKDLYMMNPQLFRVAFPVMPGCSPLPKK